MAEPFNLLVFTDVKCLKLPVEKELAYQRGMKLE